MTKVGNNSLEESDVERCKHGNSAPEHIFLVLPPSQAGTGRHKCVICAYKAGRNYQYKDEPLEECQHGRFAPISILSTLPDSQAGLGRHKCVVCAFAQGDLYKSIQESIDTEKVTHGSDLKNLIPQAEGKKKIIQHIKYERSSKNRALAIFYHGTKCMACGFDFNSIYGADYARNFIEVHHLKPLSKLHGQRIDPEHDLATLCSNCHSMAHRQRDRILNVREIERLLNRS